MSNSQIDLAETADFDLGNLRVSPARREVRFNGERRELEPKVAQVLVALAAARPAVVSRDRLIEQCWDGRVVGDNSLNRCILALRHLAKEFSPAPFAIETVPRIGYCLVERLSPSPASDRREARPWARAAVAIAVLGVIASGFAWLHIERQESAPANLVATHGEAYNLTLTAQGLLSTRSRRAGRTATDLLRDAINIDPGYAPAWSSLAIATQLDGALGDREGYIAAITQARGFAQHALRLAPDLAEAHRSLGTLFGFGSPEAEAQFEQAAALEPNNAANLVWLGVALGAAGKFGQELAAYQQAAKLDPSFNLAIQHTALAIAEMGDRTGAEAFAKNNYPGNMIQQNMTLGRIAWTFGDFSGAAGRWSMVVESHSPRWSQTAQRNLQDAAFLAGLVSEPSVDVPSPPDLPHLARVWMDTPPSRAVWLSRNRDSIAAQVYRQDNLVAAKLMINAGRTDDLVASYDSRIGLLGIGFRTPLRADQLSEVPVVALVLQKMRRTTEAESLLKDADAIIGEIYRRGPAPFWFDADAAAIWAMQGQTSEALTALERALARGWTHTRSTDLRNIADEPAFRSLRTAPRFEKVRATLSAQLSHERLETAQLGIALPEITKTLQ